MRATEMIAGMSGFQTPDVLLAYGGLDSGFNSVAQTYLDARVFPPAFMIDFGGVSMSIHAITGECIGGGISSEVSVPPANIDLPEGDVESTEAGSTDDSNTGMPSASSTGLTITLMATSAVAGGGIVWFLLKRVR